MDIWGTTILATLDEILNEVKVQSGGNILNIMKHSNNDIQTQCPFHGDGNERKPSFGITKVKKIRDKRTIEVGTAHCFTCGYNAELPEFISNCFGIQDGGKYGFKWLKDTFIQVKMLEKAPIRLDLNEEKETKEYTYLSEEVLKSYRYDHPYMYQRGLTEEVIDFFDIGYDRASNSITFPVWDFECKGVMFVQKRSVKTKFFDTGDGSLRGETLFGIQAVRHYMDKIDSITLCESPIDVLTCWVNKKPAVGFMGMPTYRQIELLNSLPIKTFYSGMDNDEFGDKGHNFLSKMLKKKDLKRLTFPAYAKDLNDVRSRDFESLYRERLFKL